MIRYLKVTLVDGSRFILRVTGETPLLIRGYEVDAEGDEVVPPGYERRLRVVGRDSIKRSVPMRMNPTYARLEVAPNAGARVKKRARVERSATPKTAAQLDAEIAEALSGPEWLVTRPKQRVDPKTYREIIKKAVKFPAFKNPSKYTWDLVRDVPIYALDPGSKFDYENDEEDAEEADENLARYYRVKDLLMHQGKKPWPIVVDQDGEVIDGHHRLAVLNDQGIAVVDVLWVRPRNLTLTRRVP